MPIEYPTANRGKRKDDTSSPVSSLSVLYSSGGENVSFFWTPNRLLKGGEGRGGLPSRDLVRYFSSQLAGYRDALGSFSS